MDQREINKRRKKGKQDIIQKIKGRRGKKMDYRIRELMKLLKKQENKERNGKERKTKFSEKKQTDGDDSKGLEK